MAINKLNQVPNNDFRMYELIDPEQFDANNAALVAKIDELVDEVNTHLTNINALLSAIGTVPTNAQLASTIDNSSGADRIGCTTITGIVGNTVQSALEGLKLAIDVTQLGQIVDGSITNIKLNSDIKVGSLASLTTTDKTSVVNAINEMNGLFVTSAAPNKILKLDSNSKLPANITGDANSVGGYTISSIALKTDIIDLQNKVTNSLNKATVALSNSSPTQSFTVSDPAPVDFSFTASDIVANILGTDGDCEVITLWQATNAGILSLDTSKKVFGNNAIKITLSQTGYDSAYKTISNINLDITKYYMVSAYLDKGNATNVKLMKDNTGGGNMVSSTVTATTMTRTAIKVSPSDFVAGNCIGVQANGSIGQYVFMDGVMVKEITATEYNTLSEQQLMDKYPYINGVKPLTNVRLFNSSENLVYNGNCEDGVNGWAVDTGATLTVENNQFKIVSTVAYAGISQKVKVKPNTNYYILRNVSGNVDVYVFDASNGTTLKGVGGSSSFNTGNTNEIRIVINGSTTGTGYADSISLTEGTTTPAAYKSHKDSSIILNGEFCKIPNSTYADTVKSENGLVKKLKTVQKVKVDGSLPGISFYSDGTGAKLIALGAGLMSFLGAVSGVGAAYRYDGKQMTVLGDGQWVATAKDVFYIAAVDGTSRASIAIADSDSGWGETYTPSIAEQQACLNGYKMNNGTFGTPYNGTGTKTWTTWNATNNTGSVTTVPTGKAPGWDCWCTAFYALSQPVPEIIDVALGSVLTTFTGLNTITVDTGIVYEKAKFYYDSTFHNYVINQVGYSDLTCKAKTILDVTKNGASDFNRFTSDATQSVGNARTWIAEANYDSKAEYYVLYQMMPQEYNSQQISATVSYPQNLRDAHAELAETAAGISSKVESIESTLLKKLGAFIGCRVTNSATQSIPNTTGTPLTFDTEIFDTNGIHDTSTNNTRLTCQTAGKYLIIGNIAFAGNGTGYRYASIRKNGTLEIAIQSVVPASVTSSMYISVATIAEFVVGDYVELLAAQTSGGALSTTQGAWSPIFSMMKVGD